jgi:hypothetical protein
MLRTGETVRAKEAVGWLVDHAATMDESLRAAWTLAIAGERAVRRRAVEPGRLEGVIADPPGIPGPASAAEDEVRRAFVRCIEDSCRATAAEALAVQARHAAESLASPACRTGRVGAERTRTMSGQMTFFDGASGERR